MNEAQARNSIIIALDMEPKEAVRLAEKLRGRAQWVKVGMTLYYSAGPSIVHELHQMGLKVFLDLKLFDIPHQVRLAAQAASEAGVDLLSIHALGGTEMVKAARAGVEAAAHGGERTKILAISILTSMDQDTLSSIGIDHELTDEVRRLAKLATGAGADGMVCSPKEVHMLRELLGEDVLLVTPGVRPKGAAKGDQKRVATPQQAIADGASKLVIGRPITQAPDPAQAYEDIVGNLAR